MSACPHVKYLDARLPLPTGGSKSPLVAACTRHNIVQGREVGRKTAQPRLLGVKTLRQSHYRNRCNAHQMPPGLGWIRSNHSLTLYENMRMEVAWRNSNSIFIIFQDRFAHTKSSASKKNRNDGRSDVCNSKTKTLQNDSKYTFDILGHVVRPKGMDKAACTSGASSSCNASLGLAKPKDQNCRKWSQDINLTQVSRRVKTSVRIVWGQMLEDKWYKCQEKTRRATTLNCLGGPQAANELYSVIQLPDATSTLMLQPKKDKAMRSLACSAESRWRWASIS